MTKYRLKDQELQKKLDELSDGDFSKRLESGLVSKEYPAEIYCVSCDLYAGTKRGRIEIRLTGCEIETVQKYDPKAWNSYPEVTPPEGVLMRVETEGGKKFCGFYHTFVEGGCWCYEDGTVCPEAISKSVKRYRTWE